MKRRLSAISMLHYFRMLYRGILFLWAAITYIVNPKFHDMKFEEGFQEFKGLLVLIWLVFAFEMLMRFFPSPTESMGCQKQFRKNFLPVGKGLPDMKSLNRGVWTVVASWLLLNGGIFWLYFKGIITDGILLLISMFYSVCDMICILFFCPFQTWMMKNRCCTTCRIYNWDYLMMFTPLVVIPSTYTWSLSALAFGLFLRWEIAVKRHVRWFSDETNAALRCLNCQEKLCAHKKQLKSFWEKEFKIIEFKWRD